MSWRSRRRAWGLALALGATTAAPAVAQLPRREFQVMVAGLASEPAVGLVGAGVNRRDARRGRIGIAVLGGAAEGGRIAGRTELAWHFQLDPGRRTGWGVYAGGGVGVGAVERDHVRPWVQAVLGAESGPGSGGGIFVEAGFGGGLRLAAGWRWRKQNAPDR